MHLPAKSGNVALMPVHDYLRFILSLAFVLSLMGLCAWLVRRFGIGGAVQSGKKRRLHVIETRTIDHRHKLVLASCDGQEHLLLLGPNGQNVVQTLPKTQEQTPS